MALVGGDARRPGTYVHQVTGAVAEDVGGADGVGGHHKIVAVVECECCHLSVLCFGLIPEHSLHVGIGMAITNYVGQKLRRSK